VASVDSHTSLSTLDEMDDDELALLGAPWAKEGMLQHKQYWESAGKRAKKNEWKQFFVVVSKGELFMFTFGDRGGVGFAGGSVGGGNWLVSGRFETRRAVLIQTNANPVGKLDLMHAMAAALPKPGYSAERPYCFSIVLPSGQTTFFQAGTEDLVSEWVATCNYWSARRSRQPLTGGVSNMEYGWQKVVPVYTNGASDEHDRDHDHDHDDKASVRSGRSSMSKFGGTYGRRTLAPADRMHINDWRPPMPASMPSPLDEEAQLEALQVYIESLKKELDEHKAIEEPMIRQVSAARR
jgi:PH/SEC7 domain-containing protein